MTKPLIDVPSGQLLASGLFPGADPAGGIPLWEDGRNIEFSEGKIRKSKGWTLPAPSARLFDDGVGDFDDGTGLFDSGEPAAAPGVFSTGIAVPIRGLKQMRLGGGGGILFFGTADGLYWGPGGAAIALETGLNGLTDQTAYSRASWWSMQNWGNWMFFANGIDPCRVFKNFSITTMVGTSFRAAEILLRFGPHLLAFNTDYIGRQGYEFSAAGNPELWDPVVYATAGNNVIREALTDIVAAVPLGRAIAVYTEENQFILQYLGSPLFFGHFDGAKGIGAYSKKSVVPVSNLNFGIGPGPIIYRTDGVSFDRVDGPALRSWLESNLNVAQASKIVGFHDELEHRVVWFVPTGANTENDIGIGYNYRENNWTFYGYGRSDAEERSVFTGPLEALSNGSMFLHGQGVNANGSALESYVQTRPLDGGDPRMWKYLDAFRAAVDDMVGTPQWQIGVKEEIDDNYSWTSLVNLSAGFQYAFDGLPVGGVFFAVKIYSNAVDDDFKISRLEVGGEPGGEVL